MTAVMLALGSVIGSVVGLSALMAPSGGDPLAGVAALVVLLAVAVVASAAAVASRAVPVRTGLDGRLARRPADLRPLRVADPDAAGRRPRPRAPALGGAAPAR